MLSESHPDFPLLRALQAAEATAKAAKAASETASEAVKAAREVARTLASRANVAQARVAHIRNSITRKANKALIERDQLIRGLQSSGDPRDAQQAAALKAGMPWPAPREAVQLSSSDAPRDSDNGAW